jgi:hypothetical protein
MASSLSHVVVVVVMVMASAMSVLVDSDWRILPHKDLRRRVAVLATRVHHELKRLDVVTRKERHGSTYKIGSNER